MLIIAEIGYIDFKCIDLSGNWYYWDSTDRVKLCKCVDFSSLELLVGDICAFL